MNWQLWSHCNRKMGIGSSKSSVCNGWIYCALLLHTNTDRVRLLCCMYWNELDPKIWKQTRYEIQLITSMFSICNNIMCSIYVYINIYLCIECFKFGKQSNIGDESCDWWIYWIKKANWMLNKIVNIRTLSGSKLFSISWC